SAPRRDGGSRAAEISERRWGGVRRGSPRSPPVPDAMGEIVAKINALGFNHPSAQHLQSLGERAIRSMLVQSIFARSFEHIAPRERQNFNEFVGRWAESLEREIAARLGETKQKEGGEHVAA